MSALRVATVPDTHPYITAVRPDSMRHLRLTPLTATGWERSPLLDPSVLGRALVDVDVVHVHFGYEGLPPAQLEAFAAGVRECGSALVVTVHDLRNPHDREPNAHLAHLGILVTTADAVITLTSGAAAEIDRRWGRAATVIPHPSLLTTPEVRVRGDRRARAVVGLHLKSLRTNLVEPLPLVLAAAAGARDAEAVLRVDVHDPGADPSVLSGLAGYAGRGLIDLHPHERFSDHDLLAYLRGLDVSVLPYRFGSHSGWLEMCRDLGVAVVAPDCGFYAEQWDAVTTFANNERTGLDPASLRRAVHAAAQGGAPEPADRVDRLHQLSSVRAAHARVYSDAIRHHTRAGLVRP